MPRYRKKKYFMEWYSLKLHSDVFLFEQLHCNTTNFHTMNNQIHYNSCVYGEKIINIRGIVMLCFTTIHHHCPPSVKDLRSRFTLLLTIILSEDRHLLDNTIWQSSLISYGQRSRWLWKLVVCLKKMADVLNNCFPALAHSSENSNEKIDAFNSDGNPFVLNARHICRIKDKFHFRTYHSIQNFKLLLNFKIGK